MAQPTLEQIQQIVSDILNIPRETVTAQFSREMCDTWDSMQHLSVVLAVEQTFGLEFSAQEIEQMISVDRITTLVEKKCTGNGKK